MSSQQQHKMWVLTMALSVAVMALFVVVAKQSRRLDAITQGPRGMFVQKMMPGEARPFVADRVFAKDTHELFTDPNGKFAFMHPRGTYVWAKTSTSTRAGVNGTTTSITLAAQPLSEGPVPDMTIVIEDGYSQSVEFKTWENLDIPYFADLVSSFRFLEAPTSTPRS